MNDNSYHTVISIINAFEKSVNFHFNKESNRIVSSGMHTLSIGQGLTLLPMKKHKVFL